MYFLMILSFVLTVKKLPSSTSMTTLVEHRCAQPGECSFLPKARIKLGQQVSPHVLVKISKLNWVSCHMSWSKLANRPFLMVTLEIGLGILVGSGLLLLKLNLKRILLDCCFKYSLHIHSLLIRNDMKFQNVVFS